MESKLHVIFFFTRSRSWCRTERKLVRSERGIVIGLTIVKKIEEFRDRRVSARNDVLDQGGTAVQLAAPEEPAVVPWLPECGQIRARPR